MTATIQPNYSFEYGTARVRDMSVVTTEVEKAARGRPLQRVRTATKIIIGDRGVLPTKRFWTSLQCRFGFSNNIFRYFDHKEVFDRVSERAPDDNVRYCIEHNDKTGDDRMLAVTNPTGSCVRHDQLMELVEQHGVSGTRYDNGKVCSTHTPRVDAAPFDVAGEQFVRQFCIDTPIDGFGRPNIYLSMLRLICSNGAIGYGPAFRSELSIGGKDDDVSFALDRAMDGFNNEEGFAAMRDRFAAAARSWASVNEAQRLYKLLAQVASVGHMTKLGREQVITDNGCQIIETTLPIFERFHKMTGDLSQIYGLANLDSLSLKRQRTLPTACKVYDLLNFASEVATHYSTAEGGRKLQAYIGDLLATEFDLEGTVDEFSDWQDFFLEDEAAIESRKATRWVA